MFNISRNNICEMACGPQLQVYKNEMLEKLTVSTVDVNLVQENIQEFVYNMM